MSAGSIQVPIPTVIQRGWKDQRIEWVFTTSNIIPSGGIISIVFSGGATWLFTANPSKCYL